MFVITSVWSWKLHIENGSRVPWPQRAAHFSDQQLWHDVGSVNGNFIPMIIYKLNCENFILLYCLKERTSDESKESECFKSLLHARTQEFVEEARWFDFDCVVDSSIDLWFFPPKVLSPYFGGMIAFVKDTELSLERTPRAKIIVDDREHK